MTGTVPLGAINQECAELLTAIEGYDPLRLASCFGGLLCEPLLQSNCVRLETLVHLSLARARGSKKPNEKIVQRLFEGIGSSSVGRLEDPAEDVFVSLIVTSRGNFRVLEGIWESAGFHTQRIVKALDLLPPYPRFNGIKDCVYELLRLSDLVCERASLNRLTEGNTIPQEKISSAVLGRLSSVRRHIRFSEADLAENGISLDQLSPFAFDPSTRADLTEDNIGHSSLERHPLLYRNGDLYLLLPTAITSAIRRFVIEEMDTPPLRDALAGTLAFELAGAISKIPLLGERTGAPMEFKKTDNGLLAGVMTAADRGIYVNFVFFADTLDDFEEDGLVGVFPRKNPDGLLKDIERWIDEAYGSATNSVDFRAGVTLLVSCGVGRAMLDLTPERVWANWQVEAIGASDLFTLSWLPEFKPMSLWRLLKGREKLESIGVNLFNVNGLLNLVGWSRMLGGHLVPHASLPETFIDNSANRMILVEQNALLKVRQEAIATFNEHACQFIDGRFFVVRRTGDSIFEEDQARPFYFSEDSDGRWPRTVYETTRRAWWVQLETTDATAGQWAYQRHQMLQTWICLSASILDAEFPSLSEGPILWRLKFSGELGDKLGTGEREFLDLEKTLPFIGLTIDSPILTMEIEEGFERAIFNPENVAERALVTKLVEGISELAGDPVDVSRRDIIVAKIVTSPQARQSHAFMARNFRDYVRRSIKPSPVKIDVDDGAIVKLGLGWRVRNPSEGSEVKGREECTSYLNAVVRTLEDEICGELRTLDRQAVINFALMNHESAMADRDNWRRTSAAVVALHKDKAATLSTIAIHEAELNAIFQATRLMVEFAICECPETGGRRPGNFDMSSMMSKIMLTCGLGGWSDAIHWQAMEPLVRITPLGDIHANVSFHEEVLTPYGQAATDLTVQDNIKNYAVNLQERTVDDGKSTQIDPEFLEAFEEQFGAPLELTRLFVDGIENMGFKRERAVFSVKRSELVGEMTDAASLEERTVENLLEFLTFKGRPRWRDVPNGFSDNDIFPWRFRRRLSVLRRPLVQIDSSDDPTFLVAPGIVRDSFRYMFRQYYTGDFPRWQLTAKMNKWAGKSRDRMGSEFSEQVASKLRELGWNAEVEVKVTKLLRKGFDRDYGDVDVLAWKPGTARVLLIECKDVQHRKTDGEIAEQLLDFRGELNADGKPDLLLKHLNRVALIEQHVPEVMKYVRIDQTPELEPLLVFKNPVPMKFAWQRLEERIRLRLFSDLSSL